MTVIQATDRLADQVVLALPTFRLFPGEPLGTGLKRLGVTEIDQAITGFYDGEEAFRGAVHECRKSTKRVRGMLRLIRFEIGDKIYHFENASMRDTAHLLAEIRDASVTVDAIAGLRTMYGPLLAEGTFDETWDKLMVRRDRIEERAMEDPRVVPRVVADLERARARYASWPLDPGGRAAYGMGIRDDYRAIGPGLQATHRRGRRDMVTAYKSPSPQHLHLWRKQVKYLKHQMEILTPMWPEVMIGMALTLDRIADLLGQDHDLAGLLQLLADRPDLCPNPLERSLMSALALQRRADLQTASRILGRRIYAESPAALHSRFEAYWESMEMARTIQLTSLSA
ncbi:MAG: CHAD domain-containing protein [Acidimicrobiia bacterium]